MGYWHSSKHGCRDIFKLGKPRSNYQTQAGDEETQRDPFWQHGEPHRGPPRLAVIGSYGALRPEARRPECICKNARANVFG